MPLQKSARTPGLSRYNQPDGPGGWYYTAWRRRRSLKVSTTSQAQDLIRCYEAMTPGMYTVNLAAKEDAERRFYRGVLVQPTSYEHLLLPRHTPKKRSRGAGSVGRRKTSVTGTRILKTKTLNPAKELNVLQGEGNQVSESSCVRGSDIERTQPPIAAPPAQTARKLQKQVRFDEDSEWIDISDEGASAFLEGEEDELIFTIDDNEYILL